MEKLMADVLFMVQTNAPYRTGELRRSFQVEPTEDGFVVWTEIPYMQYTNEPWTFNRRWGKVLQNPREGWFDRTVEEIARYIAGMEGGYVVVR